MVAKNKEHISIGVAAICATFNNTIVSITNTNGDVVVWASAGSCGFKGSRKSTPYAAQVTADRAVKKAMGLGLKVVSVKLKGAGAGRESAVRALSSALNVTEIVDTTPVPHNGCRPPKKRHV